MREESKGKEMFSLCQHFAELHLCECICQGKKPRKFSPMYTLTDNSVLNLPHSLRVPGLKQKCITSPATVFLKSMNSERQDIHTHPKDDMVDFCYVRLRLCVGLVLFLNLFAILMYFISKLNNLILCFISL